MKNLVEFFQHIAGTGEVIIVAYGGGSRPGQARQLVVASCSDTDIYAYEEGSRQAKQYKIEKILWAEDSTGTRVTNYKSIYAHQSALPRFKTLKEYANHLRANLEGAGWYIYEADNLFGVGSCFKNGKPKKTPSIAIRYIERSTDVIWNLENDDLVTVKKNLTGKERPWRVDSWRLKEGKSFGLLYSAMELFVEEVSSSDPKQAKGMFDGH